MEQSANTLHCLNCGRSEHEVPLVTLRYSGEARWICSQCFPLLIHHPERLSGKLPRAEQFGAAAPDEH
jgi:hypothetical protein